MTKKKPRPEGRRSGSGSTSSFSPKSRRPSPRPVARRGRDLVREREDAGFFSDDELVEVARLGRPWGVRGAINLRLHNPDSDLGWAGEVIWLRGEGYPTRAVEVAEWLPKGNRLLVRFTGVDSPEDASALTLLSVLVPRSRLPELESGDEHYVHELIGMEVLDESRGLLGTIRQVFSAGANDIWVVRGKGEESLIPAIKDIVLSVDAEARQVRVRYEVT